jgi:hypothetical protein
MNKRNGFIAALVLVLAVLLAACGSAPEASPEDLAEMQKEAEASLEASFDYFAAMQTPNPDSDFTYRLDSTGRGVELISYKGTSDFVTIPEKIEGLPVTSISEFLNRNGSGNTSDWTYNFFTEEQLQRIRGLKLSSLNTIEDLNRGGILPSRGNKVFHGVWPNLRILIYPALRGGGTVDLRHTKIEYGPDVHRYPLLRHIVMLDSVTQNGNFQGLPSLESVTFSNSLTEVNGLADCPRLKKVTLPRNLQTIGVALNPYSRGEHKGAFENCGSLESIDFPDSVTTIHADAFKDCTSLKSVTLPANVTQLGTLTDVNRFEVRFGYVFQRCTSLEQVVFNSKLTELYPGTFSGCTSLTSISLPATITELWDSEAFDRETVGVFGGCSALTDITFNSNLDGGDFTTSAIMGHHDGFGGSRSYDRAYPPTITRLVIGPGVTKLNIRLSLPNMSLAEQAKLRELGIQSTHSGDMPYTVEYR